MQKVFVVDKNKNPLMPCHPARARELLNKGRAAVYRKHPFTIIILDREGGETQDTQIKIDPGSKTSGIAIVGDFKRGLRCIWAAELSHRGNTVRDNLLKRRTLRRSRRSRKTRYRKPRFNNRTRPQGWLPPSLQSRVDNIATWLNRLTRVCPVTHLAVERVRFDTQLIQNPEISGIEYQQGELLGYEVREYLLEKWGRKCAYCGAENMPLEVEHITPKVRGGSNRVSNLTLACHDCNQSKGALTAAEFGHLHIQARAKQPLRDAAAVNATRNAIYFMMYESGYPVEVGTGGRTKFNRIQQGYPKTHWLDAVCVGESGQHVFVHPNHQPLQIQATGQQSRQMCRVDAFGFPRTKAKQNRVNYGFQTGDIVKAVVPKGKAEGTHTGRVAVRARKSFRLNGHDINPDYMHMLHRADGYSYTFKDKAQAL